MKKKIRIKPTSGQLVLIGIVVAAVCGVLYFFIAPIVGLIWALLKLAPAGLAPTKYCLVIAFFIIAFVIASRNWDCSDASILPWVLSRNFCMFPRKRVFSAFVSIISLKTLQAFRQTSRQLAWRNRFRFIHCRPFLRAVP